MNTEFVIEFENGGKPFWLASWQGDPGRTLLKENAKVFKVKSLAERALRIIQMDYPERNLTGKVVPITPNP